MKGTKLILSVHTHDFIDGFFTKEIRRSLFYLVYVI